MNKRLLTLLLTGLLMPVAAMAQTQALVIWHADGTTTDVELYTEPKVTFTADKLLIKSTVLDIEYKAADVIRFTYKGRGTGIDATVTDADYRQEDDRIVFHGLSATDKVAVYRADGIRIPVGIEQQGGDAVLPLSAFPPGVYLVSVNGKTSKFVRK